jgi:hypothetical protein
MLGEERGEKGKGKWEGVNCNTGNRDKREGRA